LEKVQLDVIWNQQAAEDDIDKLMIGTNRLYIHKLSEYGHVFLEFTLIQSTSALESSANH
jgi:hypothetical protein